MRRKRCQRHKYSFWPLPLLLRGIEVQAVVRIQYAELLIFLRHYAIVFHHTAKARELLLLSALEQAQFLSSCLSSPRLLVAFCRLH
jgi:hypothetical protein